MRWNTRRSRYEGYVLWSCGSVIGLGVMINIWLMSPKSVTHAGYGPGGSFAVLVLSLLLVVIATVVIFVHRVPRRVRLAVAVMLLVAVAAGIVPVAIFDALYPGSPPDSAYVLLAYPAIGMVLLAVAVLRTPLKEDHDRRPITESRAYQELLRRSEERNRRRTG